MEYTYEVVKDKFSAEEVAQLYEMVTKFSGPDPKPFFEGTALLDKYGINEPGNYPFDIDSNRVLVKVMETVRDYFLENYEMLGTLEFSRIFGATMHEGAELYPHRDEDPNPAGEYDGKKRSHVCSMLLNEDYEGGELIFSDQGDSVKAKAGEMVMFPGYYVSHGVAKITKGSRVVLLIFFYDVLD